MATMASTTLTQAVDLWRELQAAGGLELRRKNEAGRDADLEETLRQRFKVPATALSLETWLQADALLAQPSIRIEELLVAVLEAMQGYSCMMTDILGTLDRAQAQHSGHQLNVEFKFEEIDHPLRYALEAFRATVSKTQRVLASRYEPPTSAEMWQIEAAANQFLGRKFARVSGFPTALPLQTTGDAPLDTVLDTIRTLIVAYRQWAAGYGPTRDTAWSAMAPLQAQPDPVSRSIVDRMVPATDFWDITLERELRDIAQAAAVKAVDPTKVSAALYASIANLKSHEVWIDQTIQELLDLLKLPTWQQRYELYSVWVGTRLLASAQSRAQTFHYHVRNHILSFAFGGSHLATYAFDGEQYEILAEKRSQLMGGSKKRTREIQPDFRVVRATLGQVNIDADVTSTTQLVLECKHYLTPSTSNFANAASDYARSCPNAAVLLVNHGAANHETLIEKIDADLRERVQFLGDVQADNDRQKNALSQTICKLLFKTAAGVRTSAGAALPDGVQGRVLLRWTDQLQDVDLSIRAGNAAMNTWHLIDYRNLGQSDATPYARLHRDVQSGPGEECIDIWEWDYGRYIILATNYSAMGALCPNAIECEVTVSGQTYTVQCPQLDATETVWEVGVIDMVDKIPTFKVQPEGSGPASPV